MADVVALRAALTRLGFSAKADGFITNDQGLDTLDELKVITNDEPRICAVDGLLVTLSSCRRSCACDLFFVPLF